LWRRRILNGERLRIARDLHDELGGHLVRLQEPESGQAGSVSNAARQVAAGIERTIWSIHPGRRTLPDLACGLTDLAENLLGDTSVRRRFDLPLELPRAEVRVEVLDVVYRVVQEALTNVRKHSQATQVRLEMRLESGAFEVRVVDDGVGMLAGMVLGRDRAGLGLESMMTRVQGVGGSLSIEASQPRGVTVRVRVPTG
jgi:signal transduction histidine kinase